MGIWNWILSRAGLAIALCSGVLLCADDAEARKKAEEAAEKLRKGDAFAAAQLYEEADRCADDEQLKINSLRAAAEAYRKAGLLGKEFDLLEQLQKRYPGQSSFAADSDRALKIADAWYEGHRDPEFWALRWIPWLNSPDRSAEMYQKALAKAPFAKGATGARLRLAYLLDDEGKHKEAEEQLRIILKEFPESEACRYAMLGLGEMLYERAKRGDGDGKFNREALELFAKFKEKYPDAKENTMVERWVLRARDVQAERLLSIAQFYRRNKRTAASVRYLHEILKDYPDSKAAPEAEKMLVAMDGTYTPDGYLPESKPREGIYPAARIPEEEAILLVVPEQSGGKYLLPIFDVKSGMADPEAAAEKKEKMQ